MEHVELGFDPKSKHPKYFSMTITPKIAQYILDNHNNDNRPMTQSQVNNIANNIRKNGWLKDGGSLIFNVDGNITEFQHRLRAIIETGITVEVPVYLGADLDSFTKSAIAKARKASDEVMRKDKTATSSAVTTCGEIVKRRMCRPNFTMNTAVTYWNEWKPHIISAEKTVAPYEKIRIVKSLRRVFSAWVALMKSSGSGDVAERFLTLLEDAELRNKPCRLIEDFQSVMKETYDVSPAQRTSVLYMSLCLCSDRLVDTPSGEIQLGATLTSLNHSSMKNRGFYRKFLDK